MYGGYHFSKDSPIVYNPNSLINCLDDREFNYYWFETGTPSALIDKVKKGKYDLNEILNNLNISSDKLLTYDVDPENIISFLYQAGYLTIDSYDDESKMYILKLPNKEVRSAFDILMQIAKHKQTMLDWVVSATNR